MQLQTIRQNMSKLKVLIPLSLGMLMSTGCESSWNPFHKKEHTAAPVPVVQHETTVEGTVVGDDRTAMEAAVDAGPSTPSTQSTAEGPSPVIAQWRH